ncbi:MULTISPECIES: universal stress protein [Dyadobacter]|uniref:Universal stress protein n=2 Tax=Dyadobacter TaxID=120831 RepID=A0A5R9KM82_9BACT|nr:MULTISPECIES: universal stress protein [Dyadobacter]KAA6439743.1 universal stress protein [Dyadobacter flavalbus]TLU97315.1 universal stress protein [Dyadobacter sediminis]GGC15837.1 universal stress protein [Dyadobacter sediminis]
MKKILIPIDFSESSQHIIQVAKAIALKTGAELAIMHTYQTNIAIPVTESTEQVCDDMENSYKQLLNEYVIGAQIEGYQAEGIWESNGIHTSVLSQASKIKADLIVIGRTGQGNFMDKLIGSSATGIALDAYCPVLVVPSQVETIKFTRAVYATQLEYEEINILHQVKRLTEQLGTRLTFIKISSLEQPNIQPDEQYVQQMINELDISASDIVIQKESGVIEGIKKYCQQVEADLLIVSTRERGFWEQYIVNPSITKKLVVETDVPLLVFHLK